MRGARAILLLACAAALCAPACERATQPAADQGTGLVIQNGTGERPYFFDFGTVAYGEAPERVYELLNTESEPVEIIDLLPSCGCTVPRISYRDAQGKLVEGRVRGGGNLLTLPPGAVASVAIRIDTTRVERMNADKLAIVRMRSTSKHTPFITFELHMIVERVLRAVPLNIDLGETPQSAGKGGRSDVSAEPAYPQARVLGIDSVRGPFEATLDETLVGEVPLWILAVQAKADQPLGPVSGDVRLRGSNADGSGEGAHFDVHVTAQIVPDVVARPPLLLFGTLERAQGGAAQTTLDALVPGERVRVIASRALGADAQRLQLEVEPVELDDEGRAARWIVRLQVPPDLASEALAGTVELELDHPRVPNVRIPFAASFASK